MRGGCTCGRGLLGGGSGLWAGLGAGPDPRRDLSLWLEQETGLRVWGNGLSAWEGISEARGWAPMRGA